MLVGLLAADTISLMRCAKCRELMTQGERQASPRAGAAHRYRAVHQACVDKMTPEEIADYDVAIFVGRRPAPM